jgi:hypothetical protein
MASKRFALRFPCDRHPVHYKTAYDDGEGWLVNVSTDGCAFVQPNRPLALREKVLVSIELNGENQLFQARGEVARLEGDGLTAVRFTVVEPESQAQIRKYFSKLRRGK